jgi:Ribose/xylose/arabinose/galactoside ABC-type transport systems, permease components
MLKTKRTNGINFNLALLIILIVIVAVIAIANPAFISYDYLMSVVIKNILEIGLIALPMTLIIITAGIDLSVGSIMILSCIAGGLAAKVGGSFAGVIVAIVVGLLCGLLNGVVITKLRISPLVTTLATMYLFRGIAKGITTGDSVYSYDFTTAMGTTSIAGIPLGLFIYIILAVVFVLLLHKTAFGVSLFGIGLNPHAAKYSGINVNKILTLVYVISGVMCALASFFYLGRFTSVKYDVANTVNMTVITVIIMGGTSILGGIGDMRGTIIATFILAVLNSGLTVLNIPVDVQTVIQGIVLIIALIVYSIVIERAKKNRLIDVSKEKETVSADECRIK